MRKQTAKKVIHIDLQQPSIPQNTVLSSNSKRTFSRALRTPFQPNLTRNTFYALNDQNTSLTTSIKNAQRTESNKFNNQHKKRKGSAKTYYGSFTKSATYSSIFTQPIHKLEKNELERPQRRNTEFSHLYDKINSFNGDLITKQFQLQQKFTNTPVKARVTHSRNYSSIHTQTQRFQTQKSQVYEPRVKPKPWQIKKKSFYIFSTNKRLKTENEKCTQRCHIDAWEIFDRDDPQY